MKPSSPVRGLEPREGGRSNQFRRERRSRPRADKGRGSWTSCVPEIDPSLLEHGLHPMSLDRKNPNLTYRDLRNFETCEQHLEQLEARAITKEVIDAAMKYVQEHVDKAFGAIAEIKPYGGSVNGISLQQGDIDSTLLVADLNAAESEAASYFGKRIDDVLDPANPDYDVAFKGLFGHLDFRATDYYRGVLMDVETLIYADSLVKGTKPEGINLDLAKVMLTRRKKWRDILILARLAAEFYSEEIDAFVWRSRIPVVKLFLKYDKVLKRIVPAEESREQMRQGHLTSYKADVLQSIIMEVDGRVVSSPSQCNTKLVALHVDICLNNHLALRNTALIGEYLKADRRAKDLILLVKHWAIERRICDTRSGGLSSYGFVLMVIFYLQVLAKPVLPLLQPGREPGPIVSGFDTGFLNVNDAWDRYMKAHGFAIRPHNDAKLPALLYGFFKFYAYQFNCQEAVVSIRFGRSLSRLDKGWENLHSTEPFGWHEPPSIGVTTLTSNPFKYAAPLDPLLHQHLEMEVQLEEARQSHFVCIEDPFETHIDVGRPISEDTLKDFFREFRRACCVLRTTRLPLESLFLNAREHPLGDTDLNIEGILNASELPPPLVQVQITSPAASVFSFEDHPHDSSGVSEPSDVSEE
ncbi:Caffeine-induced death protein 1-like protein [Giardia muris]|uniref:Caffeine-induced death protein 1-like protein n=1 Tax=Giardia muris TaxID=5742 RepID=A0A4Z1SL67_GIAMU|nr:Caffeine-induced death protein 1-like protein [Giardia muris]|eukprot:TNJ26376.1 Caffeine-induced death protein 1-like protein [Giardia muris]